MKNERFKKFFSLKKGTALLLAAAMLLPMFAVGCESAHDIIKKRERADEISCPRLSEVCSGPPGPLGPWLMHCLCFGMGLPHLRNCLKAQFLPLRTQG